eukprot:scaffold659_cov329-Prasinococcus_capsulatus_cf.AAC.1
MPARGPRRDLWVVVVTTSQYSKGCFCSPAATSPLMCAMSIKRYAPTLSAMARKRAAVLAPYPVTRIGGSAADDHLGAEVQRLLLQLVVVDVARLRVQLVRQRLEEDRGGRDLLAWPTDVAQRSGMRHRSYKRAALDRDQQLLH